MSVRPVFIVSLPRSGSTLLQRMLMQHSAVDGTAEPWVALPHLLADSVDDLWTTYHQRIASRAIGEFMEHLPEGRQSYLRSVGRMLTDVYSQAALPGTEVFVDKTPRYVHIWRALLEAIPEARLIALARNPIDVAASIIRTWGGGRWNLFRFEHDLTYGLEELAAVSAAQDPRVHSVRYEELLHGPESVLTGLCDFLQLGFDPRMTEPDTSDRLSGSVGDWGPMRSADSLVVQDELGGIHQFSTALRRRWAVEYISSVAESWSSLGYDAAQAVEALHQVRSSRVGLADVPRFVAGAVYGWLPVPARWAFDDRIRSRVVSVGD